MNKALFLDRDGVINRERGTYTFMPEHFTLNEGLLPVLKRFYVLGYKIIVISNQGGISKGIYSHSNVLLLHKYFENACQHEGIEISGFYFCPHHSDLEKCLCRKPLSLLFERAIAQYSVDTDNSVMIGDSERDIIAANSVGIKGIRVVPNENLMGNDSLKEYFECFNS